MHNGLKPFWILLPLFLLTICAEGSCIPFKSESNVPISRLISIQYLKETVPEDLNNQLARVSSMVGELTPAQCDWLNHHGSTLSVLDDIAGNHKLSDLQQANRIFDHFTKEADPILQGFQMTQEAAYLKQLHPDWSLAKVVFAASWNVLSGQLHIVLDVVGLIPAWGEGADGVNGVFYLLEGDRANAAYSFAAMVPFVGWLSTGAKYAGKIVKTTAGATAELKFIVNLNGVITFGNRSQLATVIGKKANHQAHHIIPWASNSHEVVQKAADSGDWHPNLAINGINLDKTVHKGYNTSHRFYSTSFEAKLEQILTDAGGNISPQEAAQELKDLADDVRKQLMQGKQLDEITF